MPDERPTSHRYPDWFLDRQFSDVDKRLTGLEAKLNSLPHKVDRLTEQMGRVESTVSDDHAPWTRTQKLAAFFGGSGAVGTVVTIVISLSRGSG